MFYEWTITDESQNFCTWGPIITRNLWFGESPPIRNELGPVCCRRYSLTFIAFSTRCWFSVAICASKTGVGDALLGVLGPGELEGELDGVFLRWGGDAGRRFCAYRRRKAHNYIQPFFHHCTVRPMYHLLQYLLIGQLLNTKNQISNGFKAHIWALH